MVYTEIQKRNNKNYYYRVISIRKGDKVLKKRKYLGVNLLDNELAKKENKFDKEFGLKKKDFKNNIRKRTLKKIGSKIIGILRKNKVVRAGIAGSYARGEQKKNSDIDILVEIDNHKMSLLGFIGLKLDLEKVLGKKIDLIEYGVIRPEIKNNLLKDEVRIIWKEN